MALSHYGDKWHFLCVWRSARLLRYVIILFCGLPDTYQIYTIVCTFQRVLYLIIFTPVVGKCVGVGEGCEAC